MERSVGSNRSVYDMLMTVLFYTTGFICALRTAAWLAMHTLIPAISRIIVLYYPTSSSSSSNPAPPTPTASGAGSTPNAKDAAGLLFKLVHTAAGNDLLVPVPVPVSMHRTRLVLLSSLVGAGGVVVAYYYFLLRGPSPWTWGRIITRCIPAALQRQLHSLSSSGRATRATAGTGSGTGTESSALALATTPTARCAKTKLNPAAPPFTPLPSPASSPVLPPLHRLDPAARTFAPRGCTTPPSPADSTDSVGPRTPSPLCMPNAFALAAARVARAGTGMGKGGGGGSGGAGVRFPVGVGKMRVVGPEEVVVGERRAGEVFVFF